VIEPFIVTIIFVIMKKPQMVSIDTFTSTQLERYNSILPIVGKAAAEIINNLKGRGRSSWQTIQANILLVNNSRSSQEREYYSKLDQEIEIDEIYTPSQVTQTVSSIRYDAGMPAFVRKITDQCEEELFKLFLCEDVYTVPETEDTKPTFIGYRPLCRLKS
jgi:hypothetical protein